MHNAFMAARTAAANIPCGKEQGDYTADLFYEDFPQFIKSVEKEADEIEIESTENLKEALEIESVGLVPEGILNQFLAQVNDSVLPFRWGSMWRYAAGLYVAHFSAMYLQTYAQSSLNERQAAASAQQIGVVKTAAMGDTTVTYDNSAITSGTEKWGAWNTTQYGQQLVTLARMIGMGGMYVI